MRQTGEVCVYSTISFARANGDSRRLSDRAAAAQSESAQTVPARDFSAAEGTGARGCRVKKVEAGPPMPMNGNHQERSVLVTTAHRGVFFGYANETTGATIDLKRARNCIYWSVDLRGFIGLAAYGPNANCKIGPAADIQLRDITSVSEVTAEAAKKWDAQK